MSVFGENLKWLRKGRSLTQADLADKLGVNRSVIGAYEEGRAEPRLKTLMSVGLYFNVSIDHLLQRRLSSTSASTVDISGNHLRILPVVIQKGSDKESIPLVPLKASAGYLEGHQDVDFVGDLPQFTLPFSQLAAERSYRLFEIKGDSMLPIPSGAYIIAEYLPDWLKVKDGESYVFVTLDEGITYKRAKNKVDEKGVFELIPDNTDYSPYEVAISEIREIWKAKGYVSFHLPNAELANPVDMQKLLSALNEMKGEIKRLKQS